MADTAGAGDTAGGRRAAAVLGRPVGHSLSPVLHRAAYAELGLNWSYEAIDCGVDELPQVLAARGDWAGFSCTMPLKRAVVALAADVRPAAHLIGAGNTLLPLAGGAWAADNTDVDGIEAALAPHDLSGATVTVLGAGGTAQAAVAAIARRGGTAVTVIVRDVARARDVRQTAQRCRVALSTESWEDAARALHSDIVISTVPGGAADTLAQVGWRPGQLLLDVLYDPWPTRLAAAAAGGGADVRSGALVLLYQAASQVRLMTGRAAPLDAMRRALRAARPDAGV